MNKKIFGLLLFATVLFLFSSAVLADNSSWAQHKQDMPDLKYLIIAAWNAIVDYDWLGLLKKTFIVLCWGWGIAFAIAMVALGIRKLYDFRRKRKNANSAQI